MKLTSNERRVLDALAERDGEADAATLADETGLGRGPVEGALELLKDKGYVDVDESVETVYSLTDEGRGYARDALPERRLHDYLVDNEDVTMDELREVDGFEIGIGHLRRKGWAEIGGTVEPNDAPKGDDEEALEALAEGEEVDGVPETLVERGLVEREEERAVVARLSDQGREAAQGEARQTVGAVTHDHLASGDWKDAEFADYNVEAEAETTHGGREHILRQMANRVKEVMTGMGFQEMEGPHVDAEFYINDCLFMPQDHPARTHWDKFLVEEPTHIDELPDELVENVQKVHLEGADDGDGYHSEWERDVARTLNLRGHTTSLSMRYLAEGVEPPARYFSVDKVYRNDTLDPTHLLEFFQIEGWVMAEDLSVRDLMGTFVEFYSHFGIEDIEFKPHYNPYTEPSFEIFGEHPETGELIEIGNSGMFRPEVLEPHGIDDDVEVMAWGLALERLLMLIYGFEDIRDVHGTLCDLELLREVPVLWN
ncbi:MAG: phenylalanine--tRNA ligase subunit alpha [Halobacteriales archaeon]